MAAAATALVRLRRSEHADPAAARDSQSHQLGVVLDAARSTAFWSSRLGPPPQRCTWHAFEALPTTDKATMRGAAEEARVAGPLPPRSRTLHTSGTTGEPFRVHYPADGAWRQGVLRLHRDLSWGIRPWHRHANVRLFDTGQPRSASALNEAVRRSRYTELPAGADASQLAEVVVERRPHVVRGYPHLLLEVGDALARRHHPSFVVTHGETLAPAAREELRSLFGCDPLDVYGTAECGMVAWQCPARDAYHLSHEHVVVEILDDDGRPCEPGELGELVLTNLWNRYMPFIRYRTGDNGAWTGRPCACGHRLPTLATIQGRTYRWILGDDGKRIAPQRLWLGAAVGLERFHAIRRYQVRQKADRSLDIDIVTSEPVSDALAHDVTRAYRSIVGDLPVHVRIVDRLDIAPGEKFEVIRSEAGTAPA